MTDNIDDTWEESIACPICHTTEMVYPSGPKDADVLIIGEFPGGDEIGKGKPFTGPTGIVLAQEMRRVGFDIKVCRKTNLWLHEPGNDPKCLQNGIENAISEAKGRKAILLVGSETVKFFINLPISAVNGLAVKSPYISAPLVFAVYNPAIVFKQGGIGELRLALEKFANKFETL